MQTRTAPFSIFDFGNINATKPAPQFQETGITVTSFSGWGSGGTQPPGDWARDNLQLSDVLTYIRGSHSMHFGGTFVPWSAQPDPRPGTFNFDWSFAKSFRISERFSTQLRGDFFDLLNTPHFNAPGASVASTSTFGKISAAADPRIVQISLRLRF